MSEVNGDEISNDNVSDLDLATYKLPAALVTEPIDASGSAASKAKAESSLVQLQAAENDVVSVPEQLPRSEVWVPINP